MGRRKLVYYTEEIKAGKKKYYNGLSEKAQRHFLGQEYLSLGKGSQHYLSEVFCCSRHRIRKGMLQVNSPDFKADYTRQRKAGGGRKKRGCDQVVA